MKVQEKCKDFCRFDIVDVIVRKMNGEMIVRNLHPRRWQEYFGEST